MSGESIRVLHVDDDREFAALVAAALQRENGTFDVETAASADEGLDRLAREEFDCVVSDYEMPRMDGLAFLESVREQSPNLPFILFTGRGSEEVASEAIRAGVTGYLRKRPGSEQYELLANRIRNAVEQARAERRARLQERQYRDLFDDAPVMYVLTRDEGGKPVIEDCNDRFVRTLGYDREEILGRPTTEFFTAESTREVYDGGGYEQALEGEFGFQERTLVTAGGEQVDVLLRASPRLDENGDVVGLQSLYLDVSERTERERELRAERNRLTALFEDDPRPIVEGEIGADGDRYPIVDVNDAFTETFGYRREEILGRDIADALVPADERATHDRFRDRVAAGESFSAEVERTTADGERTFRLDVVSYGTERDPAEGWFTTFTDVTERTEREHELELYETMVETVPDGVYALDENLEYIAVNQGMTDLTGYAREELVGSHVSLITDEEVLAEAKRQRDRLRTGGVDDTIMQAEHKHYTDDGEPVPIEVRYRALPADEDGNFRGTAGVLRDITEQKSHERELRRYEQIVNTMQASACIYDEDARFVAVNEHLAEFYGTTPDALEGETSTLIPRIRARADGDPYADLLAGDRDEIHGEIDGEFPGHGYGAIEYRLTPLVIDGSIEGAVGFAHEVTEHRERERELERQNERLEEFASVVSHDLRNPLNVADGRLDLARADCDSEHLDAVARSLDRMDALIEDLLTLAREGKTADAFEPVDLAALVEACWRNTRTADAALVVDTDLRLRADRGRLQQLIENLVANAVEHGGPGVTVTVGTLEEGTGFYVADDGAGVPADEREHVFESGYSTAAGGTGFGLSIVAEVADAHGWDLALAESDEGGARFEFTGVDLDA